MNNLLETGSVGEQARNVDGGDRPQSGDNRERSQTCNLTGNEETPGRASGEVSRFDDCPSSGEELRASSPAGSNPSNSDLRGLTIRGLQRRAWQTSEDHGFHEKPDVGIPTRLMLMVSELAEAMEEDRAGKAAFDTYVYPGKDKPEGIPIELADVVIRIMDFAEAYGFDLQDAILRKMKYNEGRPYKHGGKVY